MSSLGSLSQSGLNFTGLATAPGTNALGLITSRGLRLRTGAR